MDYLKWDKVSISPAHMLILSETSPLTYCYKKPLCSQVLWSCTHEHLVPSVLSNSQWIIAHQASLSMGFSRQKYWSGLSFPSPGDLPDPGPELGSPALQVGFFPCWATREALSGVETLSFFKAEPHCVSPCPAKQFCCSLSRVWLFATPSTAAH